MPKTKGYYNRSGGNAYHQGVTLIALYSGLYYSVLLCYMLRDLANALCI